MLKRKLKSFIKRIIKKYNHYFMLSKIYLLEENIQLGKNISIGTSVIIKTTDSGKITIEDNVSIERNCYIYAQRGEIIIKKNSFIGFGSQIVALESIRVGKDCLISAYTIIRDANHGMKKEFLIRSQLHKINKIIIENDVWIGSHSTITAKSFISEGSIVGANSVVTKKVEPYSIVGGVPAKFIKKRI